MPLPDTSRHTPEIPLIPQPVKRSAKRAMICWTMQRESTLRLAAGTNRAAIHIRRDDDANWYFWPDGERDLLKLANARGLGLTGVNVIGCAITDLRMSIGA